MKKLFKTKTIALFGKIRVTKQCITKRNHILSTNGHGTISYHKYLAFFTPGELLFIPKHIPVSLYLYGEEGKLLQIYLHKLSGQHESTPNSVEFIKAIDEVSRSSISTKAFVMRAIEESFKRECHHSHTDAPLHVSVIEKIRPLIRHDLKRKWSAAEICEKLYISSASLYRALKAENTSLTEVLTTERLIVATDLLRKTYKTIDQISYECGFQSQSYFAKKFKAKYQISPSEFRKRRS